MRIIYMFAAVHPDEVAFEFFLGFQKAERKSLVVRAGSDGLLLKAVDFAVLACQHSGFSAYASVSIEETASKIVRKSL